MESESQLNLISYEGKTFLLPREAAINSTYLTEEIPKLENNSNSLLLKEITSDIMEKVIEFLMYYKDNKIVEKEIVPISEEEGLKGQFDDWDLKFSENLELETIFDLINAAEMLGINKLHDLSCAKIAEFMKNKSPDEISKTFTIECHIPEDEYNRLQSDK